MSRSGSGLAGVVGAVLGRTSPVEGREAPDYWDATASEVSAAEEIGLG